LLQTSGLQLVGLMKTKSSKRFELKALNITEMYSSSKAFDHVDRGEYPAVMYFAQMPRI
jgi:hypothetical protein